MAENSETTNHSPIEISLIHALNLAGVYDSDSDLERDLKLGSWIGKRSHRCVLRSSAAYSADLERARTDGIEVIIIKE